MLSRIYAVMALMCVCVTGAYGAMGEPLEGIVVAHKLPPGLSANAAAKQIWSAPPSIARFNYTKLYLPTDRDTEFRAAYDNNNLYLAFRTLITPSDKPVSKAKPSTKSVMDDDCAVAVLDTDADRNTFVCLAVNSAGARYAENVKQFIRKPWPGKWTAKAQVGKDSWTVLMTVPFSSLGVSSPKPGTSWAVNFERGNQGGKAPSTWIKAVRRAWEIKSRGKLVFDGPDWCRVWLPDIKVLTPGRQTLKLTVSNPSKQPENLYLYAAAGGSSLGANTLTIPAGRSEIEASFEFPYDGWHDLNVGVGDSEGRVLAQTAPIAVRITPNWSRVSDCQRWLEALDVKDAHESVKAEKERLDKMIKDLLLSIREAMGDADKWDALGSKIDQLEKDVSLFRYVCADPNHHGYAVGIESALRKIMPEKPFQGEFGQPARIELAKNEYESFQLAIFAYGRTLEGVEVLPSDLTGPDGAVIPKEQIQLNLVDFVQTGEPPYEIEHIGWYPDPLVPYAPFNIGKGGVWPVWVTVRAPKDIPAGLYKGSIAIKGGFAPQTVVPVEVTVWDFELPVTPTLKTAFAFAEAELKAWYKKDVTREQRLQWYEFLLNHHINPTNIYSKVPVPSFEDMQFCVDRGLNAFNLTVTWGKTPEKLKELLDTIEGYKKPLAEKGWWNLAYVYGFDELGPDRFEDLNRTYGAIKKRFPELPTMTTIVPCEELKGSVDIWVPLTGNYDAEWCNKFVKEGDQVWWYVCCHPLHPYPNYFIDYPAIDPRILCWMNWKYQVPGILYYMTNLWGSNRLNEGKGIHPHNLPAAREAIAEGKRWPEVPWNTHTCAGFNGDGQLLYPGPDGKPIASIRLVSIRDGIDDYEYFHILDTLTKETLKAKGPSPLTEQAKKLLAVRQDVVRSTSEYTLDPKVLYDARREVAEMIQKMRK